MKDVLEKSHWHRISGTVFDWQTTNGSNYIVSGERTERQQRTSGRSGGVGWQSVGSRGADAGDFVIEKLMQLVSIISDGGACPRPISASRDCQSWSGDERST